MAASKTPTIKQCVSKGRENDSVVAEMDRALLTQCGSFPYFALVAFDVGGVLRLLILLLAAPLAWICRHLVSESAEVRVLVFACFAGVRIKDIKSAANAVLPKHYSEDLHPDTWRVLSACGGRKCVVTVNPRIMVEPFLKNYLDVDFVLGTEILSWRGVATGFVAAPGVLSGEAKVVAVGKVFEDSSVPEIGIGDVETSDFLFMNLCKEKYTVPSKPRIRPVKPEDLPKPVIFHDGRLVQKPTPLTALLIILWFPIAVPLSILRAIFVALSPLSLTYYIFHIIGCPITIKRAPPPKAKNSNGVAFVCSHRSLIDSTIVSAALGRSTTSVAYSIARLTEIVSPVKTRRLTRNRVDDAKIISDILKSGHDLVIFPEGTTCRENYLLRFSSLFAELTDEIVPVAVDLRVGVFYPTTVRGRKWLDMFFFAMNPRPEYEVTFLDKLSPERTCGGSGKSSYEVANNVQETIGRALEFECTNLTRKDKYRMLAGTDGLVGKKC
ncbi:hypothetical protein MIMGU_mgv1a005163mg [Erythranthe guttata]|uniref:Phospholipid/glycerol acyltransferase domain-containing protein n=1 Tax=Erythranthe guttata TaxID=4155 RepID=A0A022PRE7_ERYGU|nr:PREDICTED: glycerol-3-phosphate 2-O-acyltransferase 4-like [Erythranthe guttata]EYU18346.1 hypothetical protein MIMGU_mgv1a005163mg [Erythranthe guttata]|eukprot:XP_012828630.1 PREDICTED: glycerol-3-phosphate 2-O-acyltransferase 4-like [Erythranthe guttata]